MAKAKPAGAGATGLFARRKFWAHRFGIAPVLPMSRAEVDALGWESCDVVLVTGDAYVDHPSFGMAVIGRLLEAQGFRVGIISQPDWQSAEPFRALGRPNVMFAITAGNMDSMVNRYTADRKRRSSDAYTANGVAGRRPDRSTIVYAQRCREAYGDVAIVIGGIEASLRRRAHYDYWSDKVRRSILVDAKADLLVYGNGERAVVDVAHRLAAGSEAAAICDVRGTAFISRELPAGWVELEAGAGVNAAGQGVVRLPGYAEVASNHRAYLDAARLLHRESNPGNARALVQPHGDRLVCITPPPIPLTTAELDAVYALPFTRRPHPGYGASSIPAYEMIRNSVTIMRGCFGGCGFCSITEHEGRQIQSRSPDSVIAELERIAEVTPGFTGVISDLGGPTANMYRLGCKRADIEAVCRRTSCLYPTLCSRLDTDHSALVELYRRARRVPGIKQVLIGSGVRFDLANCSPEYVRELTMHHVGGYLKVAPEHTEPEPLAAMRKPAIAAYQRFAALFARYSDEAGKEQYLIPYLIAAHPGTRDGDMVEVALWLKRNRIHVDQVQSFLPSPMAMATTAYYTGRDPFRPNVKLAVVRGLKQRRLHKAFLRYHDANNWPVLREALRRMGREDLIGAGKEQLVPSWQPAGTGDAGEGRRGPAGRPQRRPGRGPGKQ